MSRCFPFPPPGYEKKARTDVVDLLKKEKHKDKKQKEKKKKDKDEREDKDRKEKDRSERKRRDKKEKSKEKRKEKEREKNKDEINSFQEKKIPAQVDTCNGDHKPNFKERERVKNANFTSNEKKQSTPVFSDIGENPMGNSLYDEGGMDKFLVDLCGRIKAEEKGSASQSMERRPVTGQTNHDRMVKKDSGIMAMEKETDNRVDIKKIDRHSVGTTIGVRTAVQNIAGRDKIENKGGYIGGRFQNSAEHSPRIWDGKIEPMEKNHKKESDDKRENKRKDKDKEKKSHGKDKEREKEKEKEKRREEKAKRKTEQKTINHDKRKDSNKNCHVVGQNIEPPPLVSGGDRNLVVCHNTKLPHENAKLPHLSLDGDKNVTFGLNKKLPPFLSDGEKGLLLGPEKKLPQFVPDGDKSIIHGQNIKLPPSLRDGDGDRTPVLDGILKKRKDLEANGFLHEANGMLNKKPRPSPCPSMENGRKLEPCQTPVLHTPDRKMPPPNNLIKVNNSEHMLNGKIEVQPVSIPLKKSLSSSSLSSSKAKADQIAEAPPVKAHHPDTKYLSEILSVPKVDEWSGFDDEEWFLSSKSRVSISAGPTKALETPRVWAEAMQIESDIFALPYVIPY